MKVKTDVRAGLNGEEDDVEAQETVEIQVGHSMELLEPTTRKA